MPYITGVYRRFRKRRRRKPKTEVRTDAKRALELVKKAQFALVSLLEYHNLHSDAFFDFLEAGEHYYELSNALYHLQVLERKFVEIL